MNESRKFRAGYTKPGKANRYSGLCQICRTEVAAGAGLLKMGPGGRWITTHHAGQCDTPDEHRNGGIGGFVLRGQR